MLKLLIAFAIPALAAAQTSDPHRSAWLSVADRLIQQPPELFPFNWGEGVQQIGLMKVHERTRDPRYLEYMQRWTALYEDRDLSHLLNLGEKPHSKEHNAYCGHWSPATAILLLDQATPNPKYLKIAKGTAEFIEKRAERSPEGGLGHWRGSHQLWVDTLYMACPLLAATGNTTDAANQILIYSRHLQDEKAGLFYHMWDWQSGERTKALWGRGNGWVIMSIADTMEFLKRDDPLYGKLKDGLMRMLDGFVRTQDEAGFWHTVMDDISSYPESSATSMVVYGVLKLHRLGVIDKSRVPMAMKAWRAVNERFVRDGVVTGVSAGTVPKERDYYRALPAGSETWGTGAY